MFRCPNCGNRLFGRAKSHGNFMCPRCYAQLRVGTSSSGVPFFLVFLFIALWMLPITGGFGFFWLFILLCCVIPSTRRKVVLVQQSTSTVQQTSQTEDAQVGARDSVSRQTVVSEQHSPAPSRRASKYCSYCGYAIPRADWRFCGNCGASLPRETDEAPILVRDSTRFAGNRADNCMVCHLRLLGHDQIAYCPHCGNAAHRVHLLEWLHVKRQCPVCGQHLAEYELL